MAAIKTWNVDKISKYLSHFEPLVKPSMKSLFPNESNYRRESVQWTELILAVTPIGI